MIDSVFSFNQMTDFFSIANEDDQISSKDEQSLWSLTYEKEYGWHAWTKTL